MRSIRGDRDGLRGVIDRDWVHSNLRSVRDGLRDFIDVSEVYACDLTSGGYHLYSLEVCETSGGCRLACVRGL